MNKMSISKSELETFASTNIGFFGLDLKRISTVFKAQIYAITISKSLNHYEIMDEIKYLEGIGKSSCTRSAEPFKFGLLKGYMKKHFTDSRFLVKNIISHFGMDYGGNSKLDNVFKNARNNNKSGIVDDEFITFMAQEISYGAYEDRAESGKLTGEWIVFINYEKSNYYLTLGAHTEAEIDIYNRIQLAIEMDFPFLNVKK